jgi:bifunctional non-homologous end joining protein LigD
MGDLSTYEAKRDFARTKEPRGSKRKAAGAEAPGRFVIHKHAARRLHYDLRLEHDGVLWSWAVTKGPSLDPSEKRLAVHVEDHPLDYGDFEGTIPKGEYGGGTVMLWDDGHWLPEGDAAFGMHKGHLTFALKGEKLNGVWHLVRMKPRRGERGDNWLLMKVDDEAARTDVDILEERPDSAKTGRSLDEIAAGDEVWGRPTKKPAKERSVNTTATRSAKPAATKLAAELPDFVAPCLALLQSKPPEGDQWRHEVKFDGYRLQTRIAGDDIRLLTRTGLDWTDRFGEALVDDLKRLPCDTALLDGEVVALGPDGLTSFSALQAALSDGKTDQLVYFVFDILHLDGRDLRPDPFDARRRRLEGLLDAAEDLSAVRLSAQFDVDGDAMLEQSCRLGLEGMISKRGDAPYHSGRGGDWIKSKCSLGQEFVIVGYMPSKGAGRSLGSLELAVRDGDALTSVGRCGSGFSQREADRLKRQLDGLKTAKPAVSGPAARDKSVVWVKPELVAEIAFRGWTGSRHIRQASFKGVRADKPADEVVAERPADAAPPPVAPKAGVKLSNPGKVLWPDDGVTKAGLLAHYERVWPAMAPFVVGRPLSLVRAPDGIDGQRFFQKHAMPGMAGSIRRTKDPESGDELLTIDDFDGLAGLVQLGVLEIHLWGCTLAALEQPDLIVFDLDPDPGVGLDAVRAATRELKGRLDDMGMPGFLKTSGGKGYHVVVPLRPAAGWDVVKAFARDFAKAMVTAGPDRFTATLSKKARKGKIFIDYLRNGRGATAVAPFSTRARPGAPVSVPIAWDDLDRIAPADLTVARLADEPGWLTDVWSDWRKGAAKLKA